jgi:hypothetical protein
METNLIEEAVNFQKEKAKKISKHAKTVAEISLRETGKPTVKIPKRRINLATNEMMNLIFYMRDGYVHDQYGEIEDFRLGELNPKNQANLFASLGILIGIFEGLSHARGISKILKEFLADLFDQM